MRRDQAGSLYGLRLPIMFLQIMVKECSNQLSHLNEERHTDFDSSDHDALGFEIVGSPMYMMRITVHPIGLLAGVPRTW
ncbi:hypothetical protein [Xanthobacter wiegelii]|uniref:hypothetical protein n=1 Tax=Xanthobacter wiegelii TaxID=3119913 RepID=UPI00372AA900